MRAFSAVAVAGALSLSIASGAPASKRLITVDDLVRLAKIGDPRTLGWNDYNNQLVSFSPNKERVAIVVRGGNPETGANEARLLVYCTAELLADAHAETIAEFASVTAQQPIAYLRWIDDETLVFAGTQGKKKAQVYRVGLRTRQLRQMTQEAANVLAYDITPSGKRIAMIVDNPPPRPEDDPGCVRSGCRVTARTLFEAESGRSTWTGDVIAYEPESGRRTTVTPFQMADPDLQFCENDFSGGISPDGRFALRICVLKSERLPAWWFRYTADPDLAPELKRGNVTHGLQMVLIDLERASMRRLTEAPWLWHQPSPIWVEGGRRLLLIGALEPLDGVDQQTQALRSATQVILLLDPLSGRSERIDTLDPADGRPSNAWWNEKAQTLTVELQRDRLERLVAYRRIGKRWVPSKTGATIDGSVTLLEEQSLNDPPVLVAVDFKTKVRKRILDPNPWLAQRRLGMVRATTWESEGSTWRGGIYYPPDYQNGRRYPLLIQTHGFHDGRFSLHGEARNFIAQALASHGIMVLQSGEALGGVGGTPKEWPTVQAGYEAAIDHLDRLGLIDRNHVGMSGWSRTGPHLAYILTHASYPITAAAFTDGGGHGYWWWLAKADLESTAMEADFGAAPFGDGLSAWLELSPGFNLDRVRTPLLMWGSGSVASLWDWYAGLRRFEVPVEYWVLPDGAHDVFKVGERLRTNHLLVDWFRFWLKGEERTEPSPLNQETAASLADQLY